MKIVLRTHESTPCAAHSPVVGHPLLVFEGLLLVREVLVFQRLARGLSPLHSISVQIKGQLNCSR